jgi:hypothetical protein
MELTLPVRWQADGISLFSITPGYRRDLEIVGLEPGEGDYASDFAGSFRGIHTQQYLYAQLPFVELYSEEAESLFLDLSSDLEEAAYSAEAFVRFSRRFSSRIRDLILPSSLELSLRKQFIKDEDLTDLYNTYTLTARSTALNLFGVLGAYPLFPFYRTDEFTSALSCRFDVDGKSVSPAGQGPLRELETTLDHFLSFEGERDNALSVQNRFQLLYDREEEGAPDWSDTVKFFYAWYRYPEKGVRLPLLPESIGREGYWTHLEGLEIELHGAGEESSYHPLNLIVSHESTALLPEYGEISAEVSAGFDVERTEEGQRYWRFGMRGGISVKIEF